MDATTLISYVIAAAIPVFAFYLISAIDLYGTGKFSTFAICMAWGGTLAFELARIINNAFVDAYSYDTVTRFTAPVAEEIIKAVVLVYFVTRPRFRYLVDGAVYGFAVGIGFAVRENIFFIDGNPDAALSLAISRVLSASLMHATASALVGIALGRLRRSNAPFWGKYAVPLVGLVGAAALHMVYNNAVQADLAPSLLLLIGISIGIGGSVVIGVIINQGLSEEKERFAETLGAEVGVTDPERQLVQGLGSVKIEDVLRNLEDFFGRKKVDAIRRLLVTQANIGILSNNLRAPSSERMRRAWEGEIAEYRAEADAIRRELGMYVMSFVRNIFPDEDQAVWDTLNRLSATSDPGHVHKFDLFVMASKMSDSLSPAQIEAIGAALKQIVMFQNVDLADLENLSRAAVTRSFSDNTLLAREGEPGEAMYLIRSGGISIYVDDGHGNEKYIRTYGPGQAVGEMALLDGQPRSATMRAQGQLEVLVLRRTHFNMFVNSRPRVIEAVLRFLAERVRYTTAVVEDAANRARALAQGDYESVAAWDRAPEAPSPAAEGTDRTPPDAREAAPSAPAELAALEPGEVLDSAPQQLGGMFAALANALDKREAGADSG